MTDHRYLKLDKKPGLDHPGYPTCQACVVETEIDDCSWLCPSCGTTWSTNNMEASPEDAELYEEWSGEVLDGPVCPIDNAYRVSGLSPDDRDRMVKVIVERERARADEQGQP